MTPERAWLWILILLVYPLWGCLGYFVARKRYEVFWNPAGFHNIKHPDLQSAVYWIHRGLWLFLIAIGSCYVHAMSRAGVVPVVWFVAVYAVPVAVDAAIVLHFVRKEHHMACRTDVFSSRAWPHSTSDPLWAARAMLIVILGTLLHPGSIMFAVACSAGFRCAITGKRYPMEETPLLDEFRRIADFFGKSVSKVLFVVPDAKSARRPRLSCSVGLRTGVRDICNQIPLQSFQTLRPATLTAAYALDFADMDATKSSGFPIPVLGCIGWAILAAVLLLVFKALENQLGPQYACDRAFIGDLAWGVAAAVVITIRHARAHLGPTDPVAYHNAYGAWMDADEEGVRSVEEFIEAQAEDLSFRRRIYNPDVLWLLLMRNPGVIALVCENEMDPDSIIRAAVDRLQLDANGREDPALIASSAG